MPTSPAILLHPTLAQERAPRSVAQRAWSAALTASLLAALFVGGSLLLAVALTVVVVAAPLAAASLLWLGWRSRPRAQTPRAHRT